MKLHTQIFLFINIILVTFSCKAPEEKQIAFAPEPVTESEILNEVAKLLTDPEMTGTSLSLYVENLDSAETVVAYMPDISLATASTMKALTTATALQVLGSEFKFETKITYSGTVDEQGTLHGDLYIIGGGDPTFGSDNMPSLMDFLANRILEKGIKKIEGKLIGDASIFESKLISDTWIWEDIGNYYGAGPSGLSIHENQYSIYFQTGINIDDPTKIVEIAPSVTNLHIENEVLTGKKGSGDNAYIYGAPYSYNRIVRGTLPPNQRRFMIKGAMPDPALFCVQYFRKTLEAKGILISSDIEVLRKTTAPAKPNIEEIYTYQSENLAEIIKRTNYKSVNLYADAMLKMIGYKLENKGTFKDGTQAVIDFWEEKGINMKGVYMEDGSGLSRFNAISSKTLTQVIKYTFSHDEGNFFYNSLPIAGKTGTLKSLSKGNISEGKIRAKSGYIKNVRAYTGIAETYSGKKLVFSLLINNHAKSYRDLSGDIENIFDLLVRL
ncbi:D-alanyl-D-alanine carboxypeptidase/D-alanyl-D-alanine endopeptidase [Chondrinema litorale]|uniref:D-alanyl-D-alanine carboxypeptidase/D-alanyl-D-alanine endopeptidase n=1 Tax=Chondrinema litorale TaxID=2994555 RepID=UPI002543A47E|nr:D-alanyl-D-alanine carboxypeptidase/D-alanyl-D-alanine-endopeptidase [Chondrinema litorale]UZR92591.1 D-alanyl-D-alanine carboxypeptidase/D-alanyl-D-alanine-endopeptidase [Chondrinema litorale]